MNVWHGVAEYLQLEVAVVSVQGDALPASLTVTYSSYCMTPRSRKELGIPKILLVTISK